MPSGDKEWVREVADLLDHAEASRRPVTTLNLRGLHEAGMELALAYAVQDELCRRRVASGERYVGFKAAVTTRRKLASLGLERPIVGALRASGLIEDGGHVRLDALIKARIEPELAFLSGSPLQGPGCSALDVMAATVAISPAFEILDSRYESGPFHVFSAVADNVSTSRHVLGAGVLVDASTDLRCVGVSVHVDGEVTATGSSAQVFGHPAIAVAELVNVMAARGQSVPAGSVVLSGGIVEAFTVHRGNHVRACFQGLGEVSVNFF